MLIGMPDLTTLKVPKDLRERIAREAARDGRTAAGLLSTLLDDRERAARFAAVRRAYADPDVSWQAETEEWSAAAADGLDA